MTSYKTIKTSDQFVELMKDLDFPPADRIEEITVPKMKFITFSGIGSPQSGGFQSAIQSLYGIAFTIKMGLKFGKLYRPEGYHDFKVSPLEGLWWQDNGKMFDMDDKVNWRWQLMIMVPSFVDKGLINKARTQAETKHPDVPYSQVKLEEIEEGKSIQTTHVGPYSAQAGTVDKLMDYAKKHSYQITGKHHEIYMSDPRRTKPEKLKTVLRYAIK